MNDSKDSNYKGQQIAGYSKVFTTVINLVFLFCFFLYLIFKVFELRNNNFHFLDFYKNLAIRYLYLFFALLLVFFNYYFEIKKWQFLVNDIETRTFLKASKDVLYGLAAGILTPFMIGDYIGRGLSFKWLHAAQLVSRNLFNSLVQSWVALLLGFLGIIYFKLNTNTFNSLILNTLIFVIFIFIILGLIYFWKNNLILAWIRNLKFWNNFQQLSIDNLSQTIKIKVIIYTLVRNLVYNVQYLLVFLALNIHIDFMIFIAGINIILLFKTFGGSLNTFADLSLRSLVSVTYFEQFGYPKEIILMATVIIWFINIVFPSLLGILLKFKSQ